MTRRFIVHLSILTIVILMAAGASAQATRTWVSGVGDDVNPCSRTAPCKTFAGAISKTAAGGEISVLDPGGFGAVTITKSMTIDGKGQVASILHSSVSGVIVNDSATATPNTIRVTLRNLEINGAGTTPGTRGVSIIAGRIVNLENVFIYGQRNTGLNEGRGVRIAPSGTATVSVTMNNVTISDVNNHAVSCQAASGTPTMRLHIANSFLKDNGGGGNGDGLFLGDGCSATISKTQIFGFAAAGIETFGTANVQVDDSVISHSTRGFFLTGSSVIRISRNVITHNVTNGFNVSGAAQLQTYGDNYFGNNGADVGVLTSITAQKK
ncbi:MAG TPA: right-handed parallel beta-helix repeat-containing protein [Thermoanaerobaculia bacterium]|nr:right-handed parallel beta-helix repeat-containing protein [Thermoanaerobaculia bacterium]